MAFVYVFLFEEYEMNFETESLFLLDQALATMEKGLLIYLR